MYKNNNVTNNKEAIKKNYGQRKHIKDDETFTFAPVCMQNNLNKCETTTIGTTLSTFENRRISLEKGGVFQERGTSKETQTNISPTTISSITTSTANDIPSTTKAHHTNSTLDVQERSDISRPSSSTVSSLTSIKTRDSNQINNGQTTSIELISTSESTQPLKNLTDMTTTSTVFLTTKIETPRATIQYETASGSTVSSNLDSNKKYSSTIFTSTDDTRLVHVTEPIRPSTTVSTENELETKSIEIQSTTSSTSFFTKLTTGIRTSTTDFSKSLSSTIQTNVDFPSTTQRSAITENNERKELLSSTTNMNNISFSTVSIDHENSSSTNQVHEYTTTYLNDHTSSETTIETSTIPSVISHITKFLTTEDFTHSALDMKPTSSSIVQNQTTITSDHPSIILNSSIHNISSTLNARRGKERNLTNIDVIENKNLTSIESNSEKTTTELPTKYTLESTIEFSTIASQSIESTLLKVNESIINQSQAQTFNEQNTNQSNVLERISEAGVGGTKLNLTNH